MTGWDTSNVQTARKSFAHIRGGESMCRTAKSDIIMRDCVKFRCIVGNLVGFILQYIHYGYSAPMECLGPVQ